MTGSGERPDGMPRSGTDRAAQDGPADPAGPPILIADDSRTQRRLLRARLTRWGYRVIEAADGAEALALLRETPVPLVISDWLMPGLTGPELCRALRAETGAGDGTYTYFILLTAKQEKEDLAHGMSAGADDFLSKPVDDGELLARVKAGLRVVEMQDRLVAHRAEIAEAYDRLKALYETLERDLRAASLLQRECLPPETAGCNGALCTIAYRPAGHVGGDLVGYFPVGATMLAAYCIDVSGHGVASSLMTVRLAQLLSTRDPAANIALAPGPDGGHVLRDPAEIVADLNATCLGTVGNDLYFTMALVTLDLATGAGRLCRAGHPCPAVLRRGGGLSLIGRGGPPVGLLPGMSWESEGFALGPGDRLVLYSDGIEEARVPGGAMIETEGLCDLLRGLAPCAAEEFLPRLLGAAEARTGGLGFDDDVSALLIERPDARAVQAGAATASKASSETSSSAMSRATSPGAGGRPAAAALS